MTGDEIDLLDWRRRVFELYRQIRSSDPRSGWDLWCRTRDELFASHPQSPFRAEARDSFAGASYFPYGEEARVAAEVEPAAPKRYDIPTSGDRTMSFTRTGVVNFELAGQSLSLELYWLNDYAGGLFVPFRDLTSGSETYGAGRYLLDTAKGADLGSAGSQLVLDFNFAYNPSCAYDPQWVCPLAPRPNHLPISVRAGEKAPA